MAKEAKSTAVPKLRFPDFQSAGGWQPIPLGKAGQFIRGLTYGAADVSARGLLVLRSTNIQDGKLVLDRDLVFVQRDCPPDLILQPGDITICMSNGSKALVGKSAEYKGGYPGELTVGAFCSIFRATAPFAKLAFATERYADFVAHAIGGGNINNLKNSSLEAFEFAQPRTPAEQQKVADCLTSLDELIFNQGRKVDALKAHKRGLMQRLFPRESEAIPRLRFPEFRNGRGWKLRKIGDLLEEIPRPIIMDDDIEYSLVTVKRRYGGVVSRENLKGRAIKVKTQFIVRASDFLISKRQIVHNACGIVPSELDGSIVSNEYSVLGPKDGCDIEFFNYFAQQPSVSVSFLNSSVGIVIEKMLFKPDAWLNHEFLFPPFEEQKRIAAFLQSIEEDLVVESAKHGALKAHKKGMMQSLFPPPEKV